VEVHERGEHHQERGEEGDAMLLHIEALDGVPNKGVIHDWGTNISKRIDGAVLRHPVGNPKRKV
jgi:hypothetical protein